MPKYSFVGGLVAAGFDSSGEYLLTISHSGRGVFDTKTWEQLARDSRLAYPKSGVGIGIGPIDGERIQVTELDSKAEYLVLKSPDRKTTLSYEEGAIRIERVDITD